MQVIDIKQITKTYDETKVPVHAVNGVDLQFTKGEFAAIVGPSGSGKTTLLNMLGGLDSATSGEIIVNNTNITELSSSQLTDFRLKNIGFVFQAYNLIPVLTAQENIEFVMQLQGVGSKERHHRSMELIKAVGLDGREKSRPNQLSGGQQQRVAVARALASRPQFVLADEPTANLDSKSTTTLLEIMERLNETEQTTFIFSTHDKRVVDKAHRIITIDDGIITSDEKQVLA